MTSPLDCGCSQIAWQCWRFALVSLLLLFSVAATAVNTPVLAWQDLGLQANEVTVSADGAAYFIDPSNRIWRTAIHLPEPQLLPGRFQRIAAGPAGVLWAIDLAGRLAEWRGTGWRTLAGGAVDLAILDSGEVLVLTNLGRLSRLNPVTGQWQVQPGYGARLAASAADQIWAIDESGVLARHLGESWIGVFENAEAVAVNRPGRVLVAGKDRVLYEGQKDSGSWRAIGAAPAASRVAVGDQGDIWVVTPDQRLMAFGVADVDAEVQDSESTGARGGSTPPEAAVSAEAVTFLPAIGEAQEIDIGDNGSIFALNGRQDVFQWSNTEQRFRPFPGRLTEVAVNADGQPWGLSQAGQLLKFDGRVWQEIVTNLAFNSLSWAGAERLLLTDKSSAVFEYSVSSNTFRRLAGMGSRVAGSAGSEGYWLIDNEALFRCGPVANCARQAVNAMDVSVGPGGSVFVVDGAGQLRRLNPDSGGFDALRPGTRKVTVGPNDQPWIVNNKGQVLPSAFFARDESRDIVTALMAQATESVTEPAPIFATASRTALSGRHSIGTSICPQVLGTSEISVVGGSRFKVTRLSVNGELAEQVDVAVSPNPANTVAQLTTTFNCQSLAAGIRTGVVEVEIEDLRTGATTSLTLTLTMELVVEPISLVLSVSALSAIHEIGTTACPQLLGTVDVALENGEAFNLTGLAVTGDLLGLVDIVQSPGGSAATQSVTASFNCNDVVPGVRSGSITGTVTDADSGATTTLLVPVTLEIIVEPITATTTVTALAATHRVGATSCPQVLGEVGVALTNGEAFNLSNLQVTGDLTGSVSLGVNPGGNASNQNIQASFDCSDLTPGLRRGELSATVTDADSGAVTRVTIAISLEVVIEPISAVISVSSLLATHSVGTTNCPQLLGSFDVSLLNGESFNLSGLNVSGDLAGLVDLTIAPGGDASSQTISVSFNCGDATPRTRAGNITGTVTDPDSGAVATFSLSLRLDVVIAPITVVTSVTEISATHIVGATSCPQGLGDVVATLTNGEAFNLSNVALSSELAGVATVNVTPGGDATSQSLSVAFNCDDATPGNRSGLLTAIVTDSDSGATTTLSVPVSLDVVLEPIVVSTSVASLSAIHTVGTTSCPQVLGEITATLTSNNAFALSNLSVSGGLTGLVDLAVAPGGDATSQTITARFNCDDATPGLRSGNIIATVTDTNSSATTTMSVPVALEVVVVPITVTTTVTSITAVHTVGTTSCPQVLGSIVASLTNGETFTLSDLSVDGGLAGVVELAQAPGGESTSQTITATFNCNDATAGNRAGNITATVTDPDSGATTTLSVAVSLDVVIEPITAVTSVSSIAASHTVGTTTCPQTLGTVEVTLSNGETLNLSNLVVTSDLVGVVDLAVSPGGDSASQTITVTFNCKDATAGTRTGNLMALVTDPDSGATTTVTVAVTLEVILLPITASANPTSITEVHLVGGDSCPQNLGDIVVTLTKGNDFALSDLAVTGDLTGVIDLTLSPGGDAASQTINVSFNCSDASTGNRSGNVTAAVTDADTGATTNLSVPVDLSVTLAGSRLASPVKAAPAIPNGRFFANPQADPEVGSRRLMPGEAQKSVGALEEFHESAPQATRNAARKNSAASRNFRGKNDLNNEPLLIPGDISSPGAPGAEPADAGSSYSYSEPTDVESKGLVHTPAGEVLELGATDPNESSLAAPAVSAEKLQAPPVVSRRLVVERLERKRLERKNLKANRLEKPPLSRSRMQSLRHQNADSTADSSEAPSDQESQPSRASREKSSAEQRRAAIREKRSKSKSPKTRVKSGSRDL